MKYKNILVTGGRGFIGFNALQLWKKQYPGVRFICLDANTYADKFMADYKNKWLKDNDIPYHDLRLGEDYSYDCLLSLVKSEKIDAITHFAAESHVDNSIKNPNVFFESNVMGTVDVLNVAKETGVRAHIVSTDEVYGETTPDSWNEIIPDGSGRALIGRKLGFVDKQLVPSSPYSSSKASADLISLSYFKTFGVKVTISRCTNNAGKFQHNEKLIGTVISKALKNEKIPVYGNGGQKRHWIHVDDHNTAIMNILENGELGKVYNIGPVHENWITNLELIEYILDYLGKPMSLIEHVTDRPAHDTSYYLYPTCEFKTRSYKEFMPEVIEWYKENFK